jgi:hypothetical protein
MSRDMKRSQVPIIAGRILKKLMNSSTEKNRNVCICKTKAGTYTVKTYAQTIEDNEEGHVYDTIMEFNYSDKTRSLPTQQELEEAIYNVFIRVRH